jgi:RsmE family RNA methyltransferase
MNLILLRDSDFASDGTARVVGARAAHIAEVHRASVGDRLIVGLRGGPLGSAEVLSVSAQEVVLSPAWDALPPASSGVELLLALPRPRMVRKVLQQAAQLGITRMVLIQSARVERGFWGATCLHEEPIDEELSFGLEQAKDTIPPVVLLRRRFRSFIEDESPQFWPSSTARVLAHPGGEGWKILGPRLAAHSRAVLAIGPEGGWVPFEIELLQSHGFVPVSLGERILQVDVAVPVLVGQLSLFLSREQQAG